MVTVKILLVICQSRNFTTDFFIPAVYLRNNGKSAGRTACCHQNPSKQPSLMENYVFQQNSDWLVTLDKSDLMLPRHWWFDGSRAGLHHMRFLCFLDTGGNAQIFDMVKLMSISYTYVHGD